MNVWLPPERTFAPLSSTGEFKPERLQHYEASVEHEIKPGTIIGFRAFHQNISDQIVTLFGVATSQGIPNVGHYYVASAGDLQAHGWGVSLSRALNEHLRGRVHYTQARTNFGNTSPDWPVLLIPTPSDKVNNYDRLHDVTTSMEADIEQTDTRVMVVYSFITNELYQEVIKKLVVGIRLTLTVTIIAYIFAITIGLLTGLGQLSSNIMCMFINSCHFSISLMRIGKCFLHSGISSVRR